MSLSTLLLLKSNERIQSLVAFINTTLLDLMFVFIVLLMTDGFASELLALKFAGALASLIFWQVVLGSYIRLSSVMKWKKPKVLVVVADQYST